MKRIITFLSLAALTTTFASAAQAQYTARKLATNGFPQTAVGISGNRAAGTFGSSGTRNREDAMLWDIRQGTPTFPLSPTNSAFQQISGELVEIDTPELASFTNDYTQLGGIVSNGGTIRWINRPVSAI